MSEPAGDSTIEHKTVTYGEGALVADASEPDDGAEDSTSFEEGEEGKEETALEADEPKAMSNPGWERQTDKEEVAEAARRSKGKEKLRSAEDSSEANSSDSSSDSELEQGAKSVRIQGNSPLERFETPYEQRYRNVRRLTSTSQELHKMLPKKKKRSRREIKVVPMKEPPVFKGESGEDILTFLDMFQTYADQNDWDEALSLYHLRYCLQGKAIVASQLLAAEIANSIPVSLAAKKKELIEMFPSRLLLRPDEILSQITRLKQEDDERVAMYAARVQTLAAQRSDLANTVVRDHFINGLLEGVQKKVHHKMKANTTFTMARAMALEAEQQVERDNRLKTSKKKKNQKQKRKFQPAMSQDKSLRKNKSKSTESDERTFTGSCWNCGQAGHKKNECPQGSSSKSPTNPPHAKSKSGKDKGAHK